MENKITIIVKSDKSNTTVILNEEEYNNKFIFK